MDDYDDADEEYQESGKGVSRRRRVREFAGKKIAAGVLGILLGGLGIHKFVLGFPVAGMLMLVTWMMTFVTGLFCLFPWFGTFAVSVIGLAEGIIYLTKSDEEFYKTYAIEKRSWF
jgi:TM2 domain-containing membrane protein YozV